MAALGGLVDEVGRREGVLRGILKAPPPAGKRWDEACGPGSEMATKDAPPCLDYRRAAAALRLAGGRLAAALTATQELARWRAELTRLEAPSSGPRAERFGSCAFFVTEELCAEYDETWRHLRRSFEAFWAAAGQRADMTQKMRKTARLEAEAARLGAERNRAYWCGNYAARLPAEECGAYLAAREELETARGSLLAAAQGVSSPAARAGTAERVTYLVLVNAGNRLKGTVASLKEQVRQLYFGERREWPDARRGHPIDRPAESGAYRAFAEAVLGMSPDELASFWRRAETTDGGRRPPAIGPVKQLLRRIAREQGAFGVIAEHEVERLPARVRVLFRFRAS